MAVCDVADLKLATKMSLDERVKKLRDELFLLSCDYRYSYNFSWMDRPIIQYPQDMIAIQEIIWRVKPDMVVETGIAHGGSLVFSAALLELLGGERDVIGIDIEIRSHNREAVEDHSLAHRIKMIEGSSISKEVAKQVYALAEGRKRILVILDSNHTHDHVRKELELYSPLVKNGSYLIVLDTVIEDMPDKYFPDRPWGHGNNPKTAVWDFIKSNNRFEIDYDVENKLLFTVAPDGYLRCVKD